MSFQYCWLLLGIVACSNTSGEPCREGTERGKEGHCEPIEESADTETADPTENGTDPDTPGYQVDTASEAVEIEFAAPSWTQSEIENTIDALFREDHPRIGPVLELWRSMFVGRDHGCPGDGYNIQVPMSGCITTEGWRYTGPASYEVIETSIEETILLNADTHIIDDEGTVMVFVGTAATSQINVYGGGHWKIDFRGMVEHPTSEIPWIANGTSMLIYGGGDVGGQAELVAGWSTEDKVISMNITRGQACEGISGQLWIQDPAGPRHELKLDCSPCAEWIWEDGTPLGEACIDVDEISRWMDNLGSF